MNIKDKVFEPYISADEISQMIEDIAKQINTAYNQKDLFFISILNGAFMFSGDLLKKIEIPCEISFVKLASYQGLKSGGTVHELIGLVSNIKNKHVVILEDIVDTGLTLDKIFSIMEHEQPASVEVATLLFKPDSYKGKHAPKFVGRAIPNDFVVGYGLDYDGYGRNIPEILKIKS